MVCVFPAGIIHLRLMIPFMCSTPITEQNPSWRRVFLCFHQHSLKQVWLVMKSAKCKFFNGLCIPCRDYSPSAHDPVHVLYPNHGTKPLLASGFFMLPPALAQTSLARYEKCKM